MNSDTNLDNYTNDEPIDFTIYVDNKRILAQEVNLSNPHFQVSPHHWQRFTGAELWGFLRHYDVELVLITVTDPHYIVVIMGGPEWGYAYIKISFAEYMLFLDDYCCFELHNEEIIERVDWKHEGF